MAFFKAVVAVWEVDCHEGVEWELIKCLSWKLCENIGGFNQDAGNNSERKRDIERELGIIMDKGHLAVIGL